MDSQEHLREALAGRGIEVTQATLSRDLRELGAAKTPRGYQLPDLNGARHRPSQTVAAPLARTLSSFVTHVDAASNIVVIKTGPGHAQIVAVEADRAGLTGVIGCLAGDDTVFMACASAQRGRELAKDLARLAGLDILNGASR